MPHISGSTWIAGVSMLISLSTAYYTHRDRWTKLRLRFIGGDHFEVWQTQIRAKVVLFNPSSRPNCITEISLSISDGTTTQDCHSNPMLLTIPGDTEERHVNLVPTNVGVGSGAEIEFLVIDYVAFTLSSKCTFHAKLTDVFGNIYSADYPFENNWSELPV